MENIKIIFGAVVGYLMLDAVMFMAWVYSGQIPSGFYLGNITGNILKLII